jgi:DNA-binding LytR/AlgR family response regulator
MITCFVIDDEPHAIQSLESYIHKTPFLQWMASYTQPLEAIRAIRDQKPDLLFLDIQMPGLTGIDLLKILGKELTSKVIFTTGYNEYAIDGFEHGIIDYLLKPVSYLRFLKAADRAMQVIGEGSFKLNSLDSLVDNYIFVGTEHRGKQRRIDLEKVDYIEGVRNYVAFCCGKEKIMALLNLKDLEDKLPVSRFIRVHKSYIVPIKKITAVEANTIMVDNTWQIPIGPVYRLPLMEYLGVIFK